MKFKILPIFLFVIAFFSTNAQNKRYIGRVDGQKLYLYKNSFSHGGHSGYSWWVLKDSTFTIKELDCFQFDAFDRKGQEAFINDSCKQILKKKVLQLLFCDKDIDCFEIIPLDVGFCAIVDEYVLEDKIVLETIRDKNNKDEITDYILIIPSTSSDSRFGSAEKIIEHIFKWDKKKKMFYEDYTYSILAFSKRVAEIQSLFYDGKYNLALQKIKQKDFYETWGGWGFGTGYYYPQNLFLEFIDNTHKLALKAFLNRDTLNAANLVNNILISPLFYYSEGRVFPLLATAAKINHYELNKVILDYVEDTLPSLIIKELKEDGYLILYKDSASFNELRYGTFKSPIYQFIPNDPEYTTKVNDFAYFLQLGPYDSLAVVLLKQVIQHHPERTVAYLNIADAYYDMNDKANAMLNYKKYVALCKKYKVESKIPERVLLRIKL